MMESGVRFHHVIVRKKVKFRGEGDAPYDVILSSPSFASMSKITDWLVGFSIVLIILTVISSARTFYLTFSVTYSGPLSDNNCDVIGTFTGIISFQAFIIRLFWYYRATKNIHSFGAKNVTSSIMAVLWWFIPIFFFLVAIISNLTNLPFSGYILAIPFQELQSFNNHVHTNN